MPELPEVETVVHYLNPYLVGRSLLRIEPLNGMEKVLISMDRDTTAEAFTDQTIKQVWRRGKYIIIDLDRGHLCIHLRMTGRLIPHRGDTDNPRHLTARLSFQDGTHLYFNDYRQFGRIYLSRSLDWLDTKLGIEPLSSAFTSKWLWTKLQVTGRMIKPLLLDQQFIAGLGNIYTDEVLWLAQIHPCTPAGTIAFNSTLLLHRAIHTILRKAIKLHGTTIINFTFGDNQTGSYAEHLHVFGKENQPCPRCKTPIIKIRVAQRGTHLCPQCQPLGV